MKRMSKQLFASFRQAVDDGLRWRRYYEVIGYGWERALASLKALLEQ